MITRRMIGPMVIGIGAVAAIGWWMLSAAYLGPRAELQSKITEYEDAIKGFKDRDFDAMKLDRVMDDVLGLTLGADEETVDHRLRTRLNRLAEEVKLRDPVVNTMSFKALESPARSAMPRRGPWAALRQQVDFTEAPATISGGGTLEQATELVDRLYAEPWPKQVRMVKLDPSKEGTVFRITVQLATVYFPGRGAAEPEHATWDSSRLDRVASIVSANPFRVPPPPPEPEVVAQKPPEPAPADPPPKPAFPWKEWMITGVADGPGGEEVWLRNHRSRKTRVLNTGQSIGEAVFIGGRGDAALFEIDQRQYLVLVGENLDQRRTDSR